MSHAVPLGPDRSRHPFLPRIAMALTVPEVGLEAFSTRMRTRSAPQANPQMNLLRVLLVMPAAATTSLSWCDLARLGGAAVRLSGVLGLWGASSSRRP